MIADESYAELLRLDRERLTDAMVRQCRTADADEIGQTMEDFWAGIERSG